MADDRPADDLTAAVAGLRKEFEDKMASALMKFSRRPVGTIEPCLRSTPPLWTLFLNGDIVNRAGAPDLWQWAQDNGAVTGGLFTVGDGSTTFGLPDFRGKFPVGAVAGIYDLGETGGEATHTLTAAEMAEHDHGGATGAGGDHGHSWSANATVGTAGGHGGHFPGSSFNAAAGPDLGLAAWNSTGASVAAHSHTFGLDLTIDAAAAHAHSIASAGSDAAHENRPPYLAINWAIYW